MVIVRRSGGCPALGFGVSFDRLNKRCLLALVALAVWPSCGGTGGNTTGGNGTGGTATGGNATGGTATGGIATGGNATGGNAAGGNATGGNATGGNATGGATGGAGGKATGGAGGKMTGGAGGTAGGAGKGGSAGGKGGTAGGAGGAAGSAGPVRILAIGDSITRATCWRDFLWQQLQQNDAGRFDLVGTLQADYGCGVSGFDPDNQGYSSSLITEVVAGVTNARTCDPFCPAMSDLQTAFAATKPQVVLMHWGTNDVWNGKASSSITAAYSTVIDALRAASPSVTILLAQFDPDERDQRDLLGVLVRHLSGRHRRAQHRHRQLCRHQDDRRVARDRRRPEHRLRRDHRHPRRRSPEHLGIAEDGRPMVLGPDHQPFDSLIVPWR